MTDRIKAAKRGDAQAFTSLFREHEKLIYRIAFTYLSNEQDALDAVQETAYSSYKNIRSLREPASFKAWLCRIAANCSLDLLKSRRGYVELDALLEMADPYSGREFSQVEFLDLLDTLSGKEKDILLSKLYFDFTFEMIARHKKLPVNTVKTTYYRAIEKLRIKEAGNEL